MKILQLLCVPLYGTGSGIYVRKLSLALKKQGDKIAIACPDDREVPGVTMFPIKLPFMATFTGQPEHPKAKLYSKLTGEELNDIQTAFLSSIIKAVETFKPDVIHVHHAANLSWIANYIKAVYQIHFIITSHNTDVINAVLDKRYIPLTQDALRRADVITAVSKITRERLLLLLGKGIRNLARKTKVVVCGVDSRNFSNKGNVNEVNQKFGLKNHKVVLYSGKVSPIKGVGFFIKTAKNLPNIKFVVMGGGEELSNIKKTVKEEKIKNVIFTGYLGANDVNIISQLYRRADIVVIPSTLSEGVPLSALEGMVSGAVVIASNIGGIPTVIKHQKNGILVQPKNTNAIINAINFIYKNPKIAARLSTQAHEDAISKYDWQSIAKKMHKYYAIAFERSQKSRQTKKPSFVSDEEYKEEKKLVEDIIFDKLKERKHV
jgi:glycosyltransferase involved in cell wall biosynthesis